MCVGIGKKDMKGLILVLLSLPVILSQTTTPPPYCGCTYWDAQRLDQVNWWGFGFLFVFTGWVSAGIIFGLWWFCYGKHMSKSHSHAQPGGEEVVVKQTEPIVEETPLILRDRRMIIAQITRPSMV